MRRSVFHSTIVSVSSGLLLGACSLKPMQLTSDELSANASDKLARVTQHQPPLTGRLTLQAAMDRALKFNLDHHVEIFESGLRTAELNMAHYSAVAECRRQQRLCRPRQPACLVELQSRHRHLQFRQFDVVRSAPARIRHDLQLARARFRLVPGQSAPGGGPRADRRRRAAQGRPSPARRCAHRLLARVVQPGTERQACASSSSALSGHSQAIASRPRMARPPRSRP